MSRLVLKGANPVRKLGTYLPSPYIEKIVVGFDSIEVRISLMFEKAQAEFFDDYISSLQEDLFVYVALLFNETPITMLRDKSISIFDPLCVKYEIGDGCIDAYAELIKIVIGSPSDPKAESLGGTIGPVTWDSSKYSSTTSTGTALGEAITPSTAGVLGGGRYSSEINSSPVTADTDAPSSSTDSTECAYNIIQVSFADFERSEEIIYTSSGRLVAKYTYAEQYKFEDISGFMNYMLGTEIAVDVVSWTSILDYDNISGGYAKHWMFYPIERSEITPELLVRLENDSLMQRLTSDRTYEPLFREGEIVSSVETVYVDAEGEVYEGVPFQSLNLAYFSGETIDRGDLKGRFETQFPLVEEDSISTDYYKAIESINYVFQVYYDTPKLLIKLNQAARAFPNKDGTSIIGQLYQSVNQFVQREDKSVINTRPLYLKQIANPKIIDQRTGSSEVLTNWSELEYPDYDASTLYDSQFLYDLFYMTRWQMWKNTPEVQDDGTVTTEADHVLNWGYFFFDYEKVARTQTNISKIYDVVAFEKFFSICLTNGFLRFETVKTNRIYKIGKSSDLDIHFNDPSYFEALGTRPDGSITELETVGARNAANKRVNNLQPSYYQEYDVLSADGDGPLCDIEGDYYSYICPRSFNLAVDSLSRSSLQGEDYRLVCFEINDVYDWDYADGPSTGIGNYYSVNVCLYDHTHELVGKFIEAYYALINSSKAGSLHDYLEAASEDCSYNDIQSTFNDFFSDGITTQYEEDMANAPWVLAPLLYAMHNDLVLNTFNHSIDEVIDYARKISVNIAPYSGTLEQLELFYEAYENFYNTYYAPGADLRNTLDDMSAQLLCYYNEFKIPEEIYNSGEYAEPISETTITFPMMRKNPKYSEEAGNLDPLTKWLTGPFTSDTSAYDDQYDLENSENDGSGADNTFNRMSATWGINFSRDRFVNVTEEEFKDFVIEIAQAVAAIEYQIATGFAWSASVSQLDGRTIIEDYLVGSSLQKEWASTTERDPDTYAGALEDYLRDLQNEIFIDSAYRLTDDQRLLIEVLAMILWPNSVENPKTQSALGAEEIVGTAKQIAWKSTFTDAGILPAP